MAGEVDAGPVEGTKYTFNSTELRMINVEMQLIPPVGGVPLDVGRRGSTRSRLRRLHGRIGRAS